MTTVLTILFVIGYLAIVFEHNININKTASALLTGVLVWTAYAMLFGDKSLVSNELGHHLASVSEILFFLLGAMTIVELVDAHQGFKIITENLISNNPIFNGGCHFVILNQIMQKKKSKNSMNY